MTFKLTETPVRATEIHMKSLRMSEDLTPNTGDAN